MSDKQYNDRSNIANSVSGVLVIDKPLGMTSHDVVQKVRAGTRLRRAGHTGTLDPRASGVLVCLLYTSDAADDLLCVDLGGRRIIEKKKKQNTQHTYST